MPSPSCDKVIILNLVIRHPFISLQLIFPVPSRIPPLRAIFNFFQFLKFTHFLLLLHFGYYFSLPETLILWVSAYTFHFIWGIFSDLTLDVASSYVFQNILCFPYYYTHLWSLLGKWNLFFFFFCCLLFLKFPSLYNITVMCFFI